MINWVRARGAAAFDHAMRQNLENIRSPPGVVPVRDSSISVATTANERSSSPPPPERAKSMVSNLSSIGRPRRQSAESTCTWEASRTVCPMPMNRSIW